MQPPTSNFNNSSKKPTAVHAAGGQAQLELGDEDSSADGSDKPANLTHRSTSSSQTIKASLVKEGTTTPTTPKASNGLKRMFRSSGDSTPRSGSATPLATSPAPQPDVSSSHGFTGVAAAPDMSASVATAPTGSHPPNGAHSAAGTGTTMIDSNSISPSSTLPTPPSEPSSSPPVSRANSRPGSRKSSFSSNTAAKPSLTGAGDGHPPAHASRFTLKDLINAGPKLNRRPSNSSRKSDASSERGGGYGPGGGAESTTSTNLLKKYGVCEKIAIGKGATSVVRLAHKWDRSEEKLYAVKEFRKRRKNETEKEYVKKLTAEFCISSTLHHVNIVETVDLVQDEAHHWCEVMEYCPGGDLYGAIKKGQMSTSEIECCFKQLLNGVAYLHSQGVAHRDIKPENLFFDTHGHLKIGDYGASTVYRLPWETTVHMSTGLCGSEPYIAPEQFLRKPYDARLVDIWAVGIVYYCLLFQELPWRVAQPSDTLFAAYQSACAAAPYKPSAAAASSAASSTISMKSQDSVPRSTTSSTSSLTHGGSTHTMPILTTFPATINNIEPREARPLLRRILEPDPKLRANVNEILDNPWMREIEVCTMVDKPHHLHSNIRAALNQPVQPIANGGADGHF